MPRGNRGVYGAGPGPEKADYRLDGAGISAHKLPVVALLPTPENCRARSELFGAHERISSNTNALLDARSLSFALALTRSCESGEVGGMGTWQAA